MSIFWDAPVEPDDITAFMREVPTPLEFSLLNAFSRDEKEDNTIDFAEIVRTNRTARYRSWDGRVHVSQRNTGSDGRIKMIPLSSSLETGEYERLQKEFAKTGGTRTKALENAIYNDSTQLTLEVLARLEQAWGQVLCTGKLTIAENGLASEADFGVPANQNVAAGTAWTNTATATVLTNIRNWVDVYLANNGKAPGRMKTSLANLRLAQTNKEVIDAVYGSTAGRTRVTVNELNDVLASDGLPTFDAPVETSVDVDGSTVRVFADDKVAFLPENLDELGKTAFGITATAMEMVGNDNSELSFEEAPGIVGVVVKESGVPFRQYTYVDAVAMPYLGNARRLMIADVK